MIKTRYPISNMNESDSGQSTPQKKTLLSRARSFYARIQRSVLVPTFIAGFVFDAVTLTRVDGFWENFWVVGHLAIVTVCALLIHLIENEPGAEENPEKLHFWLVNITQFFFGASLAHSSSSTSAAHDRSSCRSSCCLPSRSSQRAVQTALCPLAFQLSLIFLSYYAFAIYLLPIFFHRSTTGYFY